MGASLEDYPMTAAWSTNRRELTEVAAHFNERYFFGLASKAEEQMSCRRKSALLVDAKAPEALRALGSSS
jgi:hypothetical protein